MIRVVWAADTLWLNSGHPHEQFCAIRSYLATTAKHGIGLLNALTQLTNHRPWLPAAV